MKSNRCDKKKILTWKKRGSNWKKSHTALKYVYVYDEEMKFKEKNQKNLFSGKINFQFLIF